MTSGDVGDTIRAATVHASHLHPRQTCYRLHPSLTPATLLPGEQKKAQGVKLGGLNAIGIANREEALVRAEQLRPVFAELAGMSHRKMAAELNARKIPTPAGGQWHAVTVKRVLSRLARRG
jgi:hypothetical protein